MDDKYRLLMKMKNGEMLKIKTDSKTQVNFLNIQEYQCFC